MKRALHSLITIIAVLTVLTGCMPPAEPTPDKPSRTPITGSTDAPPAPPTPVATVIPEPIGSVDEIALIDAAARLPRDQVELARQLGACRSAPDACPYIARSEPLDVQVGERRTFFVTDFSDDTQYEITAELRYVGPIVLMYVETGVPYDQRALERAAQTFEQEIYPRTREIFGSEAQPGVDGDNRITILNAVERSRQILGYYSSSDSLPRQINRYSNEREMFFMNIELMPFDSDTYLDVLAHEFQHMIHQNEQPGSALWLNEGMSQLAEDLNGFQSEGFIPLYLRNPDIQLTGWGFAPGQSGVHYGAAHLFMRYIYAQYAGRDQLRPLIQANAGHNLEAFVALTARTRPDITHFRQIMADWAVANLINDPRVGDGRYTYDTGTELSNLLPRKIRPTPIDSRYSDDIIQFGVDYLELPRNTRAVTFRGDTTTRIAGQMPRGRYAWWSNRSDDSVAMLTRKVDLRAVSAATLTFDMWFEIEDDYDYAFVTVSTDKGQTWETLPGMWTTDYDPQGVNYGHGLTGVSGRPEANVEDGLRGRWVTEQMDLTPFAGREILLRFWSINDQGVHAPGIMIDNIAIPEIGFRDDVEDGPGDWEAIGFARIDGDLPQQWELRLVRAAANGQITVEALTTDSDGLATATLNNGERGILVVIAVTPHTSERAQYEVISE
ncbi:immune inhibitor A domain-containing protein [Chloroflexus sp.]|uniref:immune inhibitor A domain-containing protein n=1 Tax=Chloroflexus sp. TaxID=1904827 RepID=UPI002638805E|nr:immune inhibitor A domain-containing protein [uncultured Chloroflexus sp.]